MLSINLEAYLPQIWETANQVINGLFGAYLIPVGLALGLGVLALIVKAFKGVVSF
jgi:hypothetical protein